MLYKITVRSTIDYGLQIYYHSLKLTEKERYERIQYSAADYGLQIHYHSLKLTKKERY